MVGSRPKQGGVALEKDGQQWGSGGRRNPDVLLANGLPPPISFPLLLAPNRQGVLTRLFSKATGYGLSVPGCSSTVSTHCAPGLGFRGELVCGLQEEIPQVEIRQQTL